MIIIPLFNKLDTPIFISKKYGIVVSNLSTEDKQLLHQHISEELIRDKENQPKFNKKTIDELMQSLYYKDEFKWDNGSDKAQVLCDHILSVNTIDTEESYLKLKNQHTNNPSCEVCNEEKFISLLNFVDRNSYKSDAKKSYELYTVFNDLDNWLFSENSGKSNIISSMRWCDCPSQLLANNPYRFSNHKEEYEHKINGLIQFGNKIDNYIESEQDFYVLDYIIEAMPGESFSAFSIVKLFSLFETLIAHKNYVSLRQELLFKLPQFIPDVIEDKELWIKLV